MKGINFQICPRRYVIFISEHDGSEEMVGPVN